MRELTKSNYMLGKRTKHTRTVSRKKENKCFLYNAVYKTLAIQVKFGEI